MNTETIINAMEEINEELYDRSEMYGHRYEKKRPARAKRSERPVLIRAVTLAAAVLLVMLVPFSTAGASGVSAIKPFVAWAEGGLRLDYSAGLDRHEDAPEVDSPDKIDLTGEEAANERLTFTSEEELKARLGNKIRLPGEEMGLEFVSAKSSISGGNALTIIHYLIGEKEIEIVSRYNTASFGNEYSAYTVEIEHVLWSETRNVCGIDCEFITAASEKILSAVIENEAYLISGNIGFEVIEAVFASMMGAAK